MSDLVVVGRALGKSFGPVHALRSLDLRIRRGESVTVFGPNGAGKTTLVRILAGLVAPSRGELRLFGCSPRAREVRGRVGLVTHGSCLYAELSARENLRFYGKLFGVGDLEHRIQEVLEEVDLGAWADRAVRTYSRGMEQRLALARAFVHEPELLLLDEPFSGLDPQAAERLQRILFARHSRGTTIFLTTHDIPRGLEVCDHVLLLSGGREVWHSDAYVPGIEEMTRIYAKTVGIGQGAA